jgi:hypothetical protein
LTYDDDLEMWTGSAVLCSALETDVTVRCGPVGAGGFGWFINMTGGCALPFEEEILPEGVTCDPFQILHGVAVAACCPGTFAVVIVES